MRTVVLIHRFCSVILFTHLDVDKKNVKRECFLIRETIKRAIYECLLKVNNKQYILHEMYSYS